MLSKATAWLSLAAAAAAVATAGSPSSGAHTMNAGGGLTVHIVGDDYTILVDGETWFRSGSGGGPDKDAIGAGGASYLGLPLALAGVRAAIPSTNYTHGLTLSWRTRGAGGVKVPFETSMLANAAAPGTLVRGF